MKVAEIAAWLRALDDEPADIATGLALFGDEARRRADLGFVVVNPRDPRFSRVILEEDIADRGKWIGLQLGFEPGETIDRTRLAARFGEAKPIPKPIDMHTAQVEQVAHRFRTPRRAWFLTLLHDTAAADVDRVEMRSLLLRRAPV